MRSSSVRLPKFKSNGLCFVRHEINKNNKIIFPSHHHHHHLVKYQSLLMHGESSHSFHVLNPAPCGFELTNRSLQKMLAAWAQFSSEVFERSCCHYSFLASCRRSFALHVSLCLLSVALETLSFNLEVFEFMTAIYKSSLGCVTFFPSSGFRRLS